MPGGHCRLEKQCWTLKPPGLGFSPAMLSLWSWCLHMLTHTSPSVLWMSRTTRSRQHWKRQHLFCPYHVDPMLFQPEAATDASELPPCWFDEFLLPVWQQWTIISMTGARNDVLQLFSPLLLTIQSMGGVCDSTHKITDLTMHMGSPLKAMLPGLRYRATWWPGWINFLSTISVSKSSNKVWKSLK